MNIVYCFSVNTFLSCAYYNKQDDAWITVVL